MFDDSLQGAEGACCSTCIMHHLFLLYSLWHSACVQRPSYGSTNSSEASGCDNWGFRFVRPMTHGYGPFPETRRQLILSCECCA
jgi:hypothetical protein